MVGAGFVAVVGVAAAGGVGKLLPRSNINPSAGRAGIQNNVVNEESAVIDVAEKVSPSVVTVGIKTVISDNQGTFGMGPNNMSDPFGMFNFRTPAVPTPNPKNNNEQDIGSGFIIGSDGLIVTNKHVVSDTGGEYKVITKDGKSYDVQKIYRDPANDIAILKISATGLQPVEMGDSGKLKVGQFAIAIGTALGEFRHTVTTGVVSGIGREITAGSPMEGEVEQLNNVIQTDAAINPGNSGGPLLNSAGQVIGINTAVSRQGQNIGFAIPINVVKSAIDNFNKTGQFSRPFLGVRYQMIDVATALRVQVPQGAYISQVLDGSPASKAGLAEQDIITKIDGKALNGSDQSAIANVIAGHKVGDKISVEYWRNGETKTVTVTLEEAK